jgi:HD-like signal output (HDOD) protein
MEKVISILSGDLTDKIIDKLPTPNLVYQELIRLITDPYASIYEIISLVSEDPALSFRALKLVNLSGSDSSKRVMGVKQALPLLGIEKIKKLILSACVTSCKREYLEQLYRHSLACACASRLISGYLYPLKPLKIDTLFTLGLLHDIGSLVIFTSKQYSPQNKEDIKKSVHNDPEDSEKCACEKDLDHTEIGAEFVLSSGLSTELHQVVLFHHQPKLASSYKESVMIIHLADYLSCRLNNDPQITCVSNLETECWTILGLDKGKIPFYLSQLQDEFQKSEVFTKLPKM